jgi:hypothetical protein
MKNTIATLVALLTTFSAFCQAFEGKIIYKVTCKSKNAQVSDLQMTAMMGGRQEYYIKNGNYKSVSNGTTVQWQLYINKENKMYSKLTNSESVFWNDASVNQDKIIKSEVNKGVVTILGYKCDELVLTCASGVQKYYFSAKVPVDYKKFVAHKAGNWADYTAKAGALPLKTVVINEQFSMEMEATEVKAMTLSAAMFELPKGVKAEKSPY